MATPETTPAATPLVEVTEDEDSAANADYAVGMAATQSTWDPKPLQHQRHLSQPRMLLPHLMMSLHQHRIDDRTLFIFKFF